MRKTRGFRLRSKLVKIFQWASRPKMKLPGRISNPFSKFLALATKAVSSSRCRKLGYVRMGRDSDRVGSKQPIPKGYLAVYVGESEDDTQRHLVPVIYFNHPMFGKLLKEAEKIYGFDHPGRITLPCEVSEFEKVKSIAAAEFGRRRRRSSSSSSSSDRRYEW